MTTTAGTKLKRDFNAHFCAIETLLLSRPMAEEGYLTHWGNAAKRYPVDPFYAFAKRIVGMQKVVPTSKLGASRWERTTICPGNFSEEVTALKAKPGGNIGVFGGASFASALIAAGLIDEIQFYSNPVALGDGVRLFGAAGFQRLRFIEATAYACGMIVSRYSSPA